MHITTVYIVHKQAADLKWQAVLEILIMHSKCFGQVIQKAVGEKIQTL